MGLVINQMVESTLNGYTVKHYKSLGYKILTKTGCSGNEVFDANQTILVNVFDLPHGSRCKVKVRCDHCGEFIDVIYANYIRHNHHGKYYCNNCKNEVFLGGEKSPWYNPNLTDVERVLQRKTDGYKAFIRKVLRRDKFTCFCCGAHNENRDVEVHHLDGYDWCIEGRIDETNAVTLCKTCHSNFHGKYGCGGNTKKQFEEWLGGAKIELERYNGVIEPTRKIYCYEENKTYNSADEFMKEHGLGGNSNIYNVCNKKVYAQTRTTARTCAGCHLFWEDEYINMTKEEIDEIINPPKQSHSSKRIRVMHVETGEIYDSMSEASRHTGLDRNKIRFSIREKTSVTNSSGETVTFETVL